MQWFLTELDLILKIILGLVAALGGLWAFVGRRRASLVREQTRPLEGQVGQNGRRIGHVETQVENLRAEFHEFDGRLRKLETVVPQLATKADLAAVDRHLAEVSVATRKSGEMIDTIYRAAVAHGGE